MAELSWTGSSSADIDHYNVYRSDSAGLIDLGGTPRAQPGASPWSEDVSALTGRYAYLVRAVDAAGNEEANLSQMVVVQLNAGSEVAIPNEPSIVTAEAIAAGEVRVTTAYDRADEAGVATAIHVFVNDGAGGAMDWATSKGSVTLPTGQDRMMVEVESSGLTGGLTYLVGIRARTGASVEDANTNTASVTTDAAAPTAPVLTAAVM